LRAIATRCNAPTRLKHTNNKLLSLLTAPEQQYLLAQSTFVTLQKSTVVYDMAEKSSFAYFPLNGLLTTIAFIEPRQGIEVGMVGHEGMLGTDLALGVNLSALKVVVQETTDMVRIDKASFNLLLTHNTRLRRIVHHYIYVLMLQLATSAICLHFHHIHHRLARWLLMSQDRVQNKPFQITQEILAYLLGVRRVSITQAATLLQRAGLISYHRGQITILNRSGLEAVACHCYANDLRIYQTTMQKSTIHSAPRSGVDSLDCASPTELLGS
jgi:CRP-like cAMP-binding protein